MSKFEIILLDDVDKFLEGLDEKAREKVLFILWKSMRVVLERRCFRCSL